METHEEPLDLPQLQLLVTINEKVHCPIKDPDVRGWFAQPAVSWVSAGGL